MRGLVYGLSALSVMSCSPTKEPRESKSSDIDVFVGQLVSLNGQPVLSALKVRFYSTDGDDVADRYWLFSDCSDAGYFDARQGLFLSGHSPKGAGTGNVSDNEVPEIAQNHKTRRCPPDDPANFSRFLDIMYEGASLASDNDRARLTSKTGLSAEFVREPMALILD